jgi:hypothetical protein
VRLRRVEQPHIGIWQQPVRELGKDHVKQDTLVIMIGVLANS